MIIGNTLSEIGDILYIYSQGAVAGDVDLTGYTDSTIGETATRFFIKSFRSSTDGVNYSAWLPLTNPNVATVSGSVPGLIFFEFRYERAGTDPSGILEFVSLNLQGNIVVQIFSNTIGLESIFEDLINSDALTAEICNNLLRKIYYAGIIPAFIERGDDIDDTDFVSLWSAICCFLAYASAFANEFDTIPYKRKYLIEFLKQSNIAFCAEQTPLVDLQFLANNFYDEVRKRGTSMVYKEKGSELLDGSVTKIRGEWLRLICKNPYDEFLLDLIEIKKNGWFVNQSSPCYNGTYFSTQINKTEENTVEFKDLSKYDTFGGNNVFLSNGTAGIVGGEGFQGFGFNMNTPPAMLLKEQLIIVDKEIDYEITFTINRRQTSAGKIHFGVLGYNRNCVYKPLSFQRIDTLATENKFLEEFGATFTKIANETYFVRAIIYAADSEIITGNYSRLNINKGINLRFNKDEDIEKLKICLYLESADQDVYRISDLKMRPLVRGKNSRPLEDGTDPHIQNPQFVHSAGNILNWVKNNSNGITDSQVQNYVEDYLIPYQNRIVQYSLTPKIDDKQLLIDTN